MLPATMFPCIFIVTCARTPLNIGAIQNRQSNVNSHQSNVTTRANIKVLEFPDGWLPRGTPQKQSNSPAAPLATSAQVVSLVSITTHTRWVASLGSSHAAEKICTAAVIAETQRHAAALQKSRTRRKFCGGEAKTSMLQTVENVGAR